MAEEVTLETGREGQSAIDAEKVMPTAQKERDFECENCGKKVKDKSLTGVCTGVDLGVAVTLPDGRVEIYKDGYDADGNPALIDGKVVQIGSNDVVYSHDGKKYLTTDNKWEINPLGKVPGSHSPELMKEVK